MINKRHYQYSDILVRKNKIYKIKINLKKGRNLQKPLTESQWDTCMKKKEFQ